MTKAHLVNTRALEGVEDLIKELGQNSDQVCHQAGINPMMLSNSETMIPYTNAAQLLHIAAQQCQQPDFCLQLARRQKALNLGVLGLLLRNCETFGETLEYLSNFYHIQSSAVSISYHIAYPHAYLLREDAWLGKTPTFQYCTLTFAHCLKAIRLLLGQEWKPAYVTFAHKAPENHLDYTRYFDCAVEFEQPDSTFGFYAADLKRKLATASPEIKAHLTHEVTQLGQRRVIDPLSRTEQLIRQLLHSENCTLENIAFLSGLHPKKVQRDLKSAGTTFRDLRSDIRLSIAVHFLQDSALPLTAISEMVGFSELSAFSRAFKAKHQMSPLEWRKQQQD